MKTPFFICSLILISPAFFACSSDSSNTKNEEIIITGRVKNPQKSRVVLKKFKDNTFEAIDSTTLQGEVFSFKIKVNEPDFYQIMLISGKREIPLVLNPKDKKIHIDIDAGPAEILFKVSGSKDTRYYEQLNDILSDFNKKTMALNREYENATDEKTKDEIETRYQESQKTNVKKIKAVIDSISPSIVALAAANGLDPIEEFDYLKNLVKKFEKELPYSPYTKKLSEKFAKVNQQHEKLKKLAVGKPAPDIALENPEGSVIKLSSLKGKLVLIDFWASWCGPCRQENPNVVKIYNKFKNKGFEIYGVSLDKDKESWLQAIEEDNMNWLHVSDLKFWQSVAAETYQIQAIPATVLISKEGLILAKDLRVEALEQKIAKILQ